MEIVVPEGLQHLYITNAENPIVKIPDPVLREKSMAVTKITKKTLELIDRMFEYMEQFDGVGLAAVQIGVLERIFVMNAGPHEHLALINPVVISFEGEEIAEEGCLSIPNLKGDVKRHATIDISALTPKGNSVIYTFSELESRCAQHEIDHLDGILFIDKVDPSTLHWYYE